MVEKVKRKFVDVKTSTTLQDPNPDMTPQEVAKFYSSSYPHLLNANVEGPDLSKGDAVFKFNVVAGTKG